MLSSYVNELQEQNRKLRKQLQQTQDSLHKATQLIAELQRSNLTIDSVIQRTKSSHSSKSACQILPILEIHTGSPSGVTIVVGGG